MMCWRSATRRFAIEDADAPEEAAALGAPHVFGLPGVPLPHRLLRSGCGSRSARGASLVLLFGLLTLTAACDKSASVSAAREPRAPAAPAREARVAAASPAETAAPDMPLSIPPVDLRGAAQRAAGPSFTPLAGAGGEAVTRLVAFDSAPFPYSGVEPGRGAFLDVARGGERGHRARNGQVLWEKETFGDRRVLVHVPENFDRTQPGVLVVFFHGFGATLSRDVLERQQVPAQISASGANAVLVAPQFAVDARDGSAGRFWEHGGFTRFLDETAKHLATQQGDPSLERVFRKMPLVLVAYSGGFAPAAYAIRDVAGAHRVKGVVLLDAAYGELDTFADWTARERSGFFVSAYTNSTRAHNEELKRKLAAKGIAYSSNPEQAGGGATFLYTGAEYPHRDYVTRAWVEHPIEDVLARMARQGSAETRVAARAGRPGAGE